MPLGMTSGRIILSLVAIALLGIVIWMLSAPPQNSGGQSYGGRPVSVVADKAVKRELEEIVEAIGTTEAVQSVFITARVTDTITDILFSDGQVVLKDDVLLKLVSIEEEAFVEEAESNLIEAEQQFERTKDLVSQGNASNAALDSQRRRLNEARFRLTAAKARLDDRMVKVPFDGVLGFRQVSVGSLVTPTTPITTLDKIDQIYLDFAVPERFLSSLQKGLVVNATVSAYEGRTFEGVVQTVGSRVDPATRAVLVRAEIDNKDFLLRPGMLMTVRLISRRWQGVAVPEQAILPTAGKSYLHVIEGDMAIRREVTIGIRRPGYVEIKSGVEVGEMVVTEGAFRLGREPTPVSVIGTSAGAAKTSTVSTPIGDQESAPVNREKSS